MTGPLLPRRAALLLAAADATEALQSGANLIIAQSSETSCAHTHRCVTRVEFTDHRHFKRVAIDFKQRAFRCRIGDRDAEVARRAESDRFERRRTLCTQCEAVRIVAVDEH